MSKYQVWRLVAFAIGLVIYFLAGGARHYEMESILLVFGSVIMSVGLVTFVFGFIFDSNLEEDVSVVGAEAAMRVVTGRDENLKLMVTTVPAILDKGRTVQLKITHRDGTAYRQQFGLADGEIKCIWVQFQLVEGNVRVV